MVLDPAGGHKGDAGIRLIDTVQTAGHASTEVQADRGYNYTKPSRWALPLKARNIRASHDLHTRQRGTHPGPRPGTLWIDGTLFSDQLPQHLRGLPGFAIGMTRDDAPTCSGSTTSERSGRSPRTPNRARTATRNGRGQPVQANSAVPTTDRRCV